MLLDELQKHFGHTAFRTGQAQVIETLLAGRSALAVFPTGGGKSICYQLPGVLLDGLTVVVSPLIALMKDQVDVLKARGIAAARLDSTVGLPEIHAIYDGMRSGALKLLYIAPERLVSETFMERLERTRIALLAIDESHCISEWGHNFRPEYLRLARVAEKLRAPRVLALTATATPEVAADICREFRIARADYVQAPFHRPNLALHVTPVSARDRLGLLTRRLCEEKRFPAIVYVTLQNTAEEVAAHLGRAGVEARAYHAGLADEVRAAAQDDFMAGRVAVIVATIAFGMGIDKADIRAVYHFNLPKTLENYQQEIGRAGRDGLPSHCEMLACGDDLTVLQNFSLGDTPEESALRELVAHLLKQGRDFDLSRYDLSRQTDIRPLVLETVLTYLEKEGVLEPIGAFYTTFQVSFRRTEAEVIAKHSPERQKFLQALFASGKRGSRWITLEVEESAKAIGEPRERILKALGYFEERGDIEMRPAGVRHRFRLLAGAAKRSADELSGWLYALFVEREGKDLARLDRVVALAEDPGCTTRHLLRYFGEELAADCGHCGHCLSGTAVPQPLPHSPNGTISPAQVAAMKGLLEEKLPALRHSRQITRFLCGISSPAVARARIAKRPEFGLLANVPFQSVLQRVALLEHD